MNQLLAAQCWTLYLPLSSSGVSSVGCGCEGEHDRSGSGFGPWLSLLENLRRRLKGGKAPERVGLRGVTTVERQGSLFSGKETRRRLFWTESRRLGCVRRYSQRPRPRRHLEAQHTQGTLDRTCWFSTLTSGSMFTPALLVVDHRGYRRGLELKTGYAVVDNWRRVDVDTNTTLGEENFKFGG